MAVPLLPILLPVARTIVSYVGKHGAKQAIKKFGEKYGAKVVDKAQRIVQEGAKGSTRKMEVFPWAKEVAKRASKETQTGATKGSTRKIEVLRKEDLSSIPPWRNQAKEVGKRVLEEAPKQKRISRKKGGVLKKNSIDGIATQGKTNPKYF